MMCAAIGSTAAYAAACTVTAGAGGDGSGTMTTLRIMNDGGAKAIWNPLVANASASTNNPGKVCGAPWNNYNAYGRFKNASTGLYKALNQAGFVIQFADGATLTRSGGDYLYTPAAGATGIKALTGPVTILAVGAINGGSPDPNDVAVGDTGTFEGYAGGQNDTQATTATGGTFDIFVTIVPPAAISGVTPTSGPVAGGASVTIAGAGFGTSGNSVSLGGTAATVTAQSPTAITVTTPAHGAGAVSVVVTTSDGQTATLANGYTYVAAPTITSLAPALGNTAGGTVVTVTGTNLGGVSSLTIDGTTVAVAANSATGFTFTTPAHVAATVAVIATTVGGAATASFTFADPPTLTTVAPATGSSTGGNTVILTGSNFTSTGTSVTFGATAAAVTFVSVTQVSVTVPASTGTVDVTVTTASGTATKTAAYTYAPAPTLTLVAPASGPIAGGTALTLTGSNFTAGSTVAIGGSAATGVVVVDAQTITATSPAHAAGPVAVAVTAAGGTATLAAGFSYVGVPAAPVVTAPANGTTVTTATPVLSGTASANATVTIYLDAAQLAQTAATAGGAWSFTPGTPLSQGTHAAYATASNAGGTSANSTSNSFTVDSIAPLAPVIVTPANTATIGTTTPTIAGTAEANAVITLTIDGGAGVTTTANAGGNWNYTTGVLTLTAHTVAATARDAAGNVSVSSGITTFTIATVPSVVSVTPNQGTTAGGNAVTIIGTNFTGATAVTFAGAATAFTVGSNTVITATTPAGAAGAAAVRVTNAAGPSSIDGSFTYVAPPVATAQTVVTPFGTAVAITLAATNAPTGYTITTAPPHGTITGVAPTLTYTPTTGYRGADSIGFTATNAGGTSSPATIAITVGDPTLTLTGTPPAGASGAAYAFGFATSGGTAPYSYAVTAGALPAGLTLAPSGALSGTPSASGSFTITVTVTDATAGLPPITASANYTIVIAAPTVTLAPPSGALPAPVVGAPYSQTFVASGGTAPYSYAVTSGALPAGVTLSAGGTLSGTPSAGGSFAVTVTATDATSAGSGGPYVASASYTLAVTVPTLTLAPGTLPGATSGVAYSQPLAANGGTAPYSYALTAGALPAGLTLSSTGTLSGTPTASGSFALSVTATDASTGSGPYATTRSYTLVVAAPGLTLAPATLVNAAVGSAYNQTLVASGGTAPYSYAVTAGALPAGVTLSAGGTLSGTPSAGGSFAVTVTATDATPAGSGGPYAASASYTLAVTAPTVTIAPTSLPAATLGAAYSQLLAANGGIAPYSYAVTAGALPAGLTLSTAGTLSGTPSASGSFAISLTATDSSSGSGPYAATRSYSLVVAAPALTLAPATLVDAVVGAAYSQPIVASGGTAPYSYAVTAGALPAGVTLSSSGTLSGTPSAGGSFAITVTATDATPAGSGGPYAGSASYTLAVTVPTITLAPTSLPAAASGVAYSQMLVATGGTAPFSYAVTAGALPAGLTLSSTGTLAGTPSASGSFALSVTATDASSGSGPYAGTRSYSLVVTAPALTLAPATLAAGAVGAAYSQALVASGGTAPYSYAVTAGALPAGVTLSTSGTLSGTPSAGGSFAITVTATDATPAGSGGPYAASAAYALAVTVPTITLAPTSLPPAISGVAYSQVLAATGGTAPYSYAVTAGALPAGVTLSPTGTLSGTPSASGSFTLSITATDASSGSGPYAGTRSYTLAVAAPALTLAPATLVDAAVGAAYSQTLVASGGTAPYSYAVTAGALPAGVTLSAGGTLSGTPSAGGSFAVTVTATDATSAGSGGPYAASAAYTLVVTVPTVTLAPASLPAGALNIAYAQTLSASGGIAPYSYAVTAGALPAGLTLGTTGQIAGTPTAAGTFTVAITATDASTGTGPYHGTLTYTLAIALPPPPVAVDAPAHTIPASTAAASQPTTIDLSSLVTGAFTDIQITIQPQHGMASIATSGSGVSTRFLATYTPTVGFSGEDSFAYVAVGPGGRSAAARVMLTVVGAVPVASAVRGTTMSAQPVIVDLTAGATNGPFIAAQVVTIAPTDAVTTELIEGGTAANRSYQLRITPGGRFSGTATIQYTISNAFGTSAPALITIAVTARPDPSQDPDVRAISAAQAEAIRRFASAQTDNFMRRTEQLHGDGVASQQSPFGITMNGLGLGGNGGINGGGINGGGTNGGGYGGGYAGGRPDESPALSDVAMLKMEHATEVIGAERAAGLFSFERVPAVQGEAIAGGGRYPMSTTAKAGRPGSRSADDPASGDAVGNAIGGTDTADGGAGRTIGSIAPWSGGAVSLGTRDQTRRRAKLSVTTAGLSAGVDVKLGDGITVGAGGGYGADRTKIGENTGRVDGDSWVGVVYGSVAPTDGLFVDGIFGAGRLAFDTRRTIAADGSVARGHREGSMLFGSLSSGFDRTTNRWSLSAYGRADFLSAHLDGYAETGGGLYGLAFAKRDVTSLAGILGMRGAVAIGALTPRVRVEWRHEFRNGGGQALDYTGLPGFGYRIEGDQWLRDAFRVELGSDLRLGNGWRLGTEVGGAFGQGAASATGRVMIGKQF